MFKIKSKVLFFLNLFIVFSLLFLFFYKLSDAPLVSYDEAWYGVIARNIVYTKNPLKLIFNNHVFVDHPPFGFWLMSIACIFGANEFTVRFFSALAGFFSVIFLFFIGKKENFIQGFVMSIVILSSMWFMFRARSGNLDVLLVFFQILTVFFFLQKKEKYFYFGVISFAFSILIKTLVGFGLLPVLVFLFIKNHFLYKKSTYVKALFLFFLIVSPWYIYNAYIDKNFLKYHFFDIGMRGGTKTFSLDFVKQNLFYLKIGVGKWFRLFELSFFLSIIDFFKTRKNRFFIKIMWLWFLGFCIFLFSYKTEIWHLLPLFPSIALFISFLPIFLSDIFRLNKKVLNIVFLIFVFLVGSYQFIKFSNLIYTNKHGYSDEKDIAIKARAYDKVYLCLGFLPEVVFYSQKTIIPLYWNDDPYSDLINLLKARQKAVFIIDKDLKNKLEKDMVNFRVLYKNNSYFIIAH